MRRVLRIKVKGGNGLPMTATALPPRLQPRMHPGCNRMHPGRNRMHPGRNPVCLCAQVEDGNDLLMARGAIAELAAFAAKLRACSEQTGEGEFALYKRMLL